MALDFPTSPSPNQVYTAGAKSWSWDNTSGAWLAVNAGIQGTQGTQGALGTQGAQGLQGITGANGSNGSQGTQGIQGIQGTQGAQGLQGITGSQGTQGTQCIQGIQGTQGTQGIQGVQGLQGITGAQGTQGTVGSIGTQGTQGIQGLQGITGAQGTQGIQGRQGITGAQGITGSTGGTGAQGTVGTTGATGSTGAQGTVGTQGAGGLTTTDATTLNGISAVNLFNNMGQGHSTRASFDATTPSYNHGFRFIQGNGNGPGTGGSQFYSYYIGLGSEYPATGSGSYGAMFAVDRNAAVPYHSVRYNEGNSFSSWRKIAAGYADSSGSCSGNAATATTATNQSGGSVNCTGVVSSGIIGIGANGAGHDPYGALSVTQPSGANYSYIGFTRSAVLGIGMGLDTSNKYWVGNTGAGIAGVRSTAWFSANASTFDANGAITATGNITAYYSDERLKTRLGPIDNALNKVLSLNGFYFEANETAQALGYTKKKEVGVSAQEVELVLPEIIAPAPIDAQYKTLDYGKLVPLLIEAIKDLNAKVDSLQTQLNNK